jgi:hypothetical protein
LRKSTKRHSKKTTFKSTPLIKTVTPLKDFIKDTTYSDQDNKMMQEEYEMEEMLEEIKKHGLSGEDIETLELHIDKKYLMDLKKYFEDFPHHAFDDDIEHRFKRACYWIDKDISRRKRNKRVRTLLGKIEYINDYYKSMITSENSDHDILHDIETYLGYVAKDIEKILKNL